MLQDSFRQRVIHCVREQKVCSIDQVLAEVGRYITATTAATAGRRRLRCAGRFRVGDDTEFYVPLAELLQQGRRYLVSEALRRAAASGAIKRIAPGQYAVE